MGNVAHRRQVHIQPQVAEEKGLFRFQTQHQLKPTPFIEAPGGGKGFRPKGFEPADPGDGAALLVHGQKHRNPAGCLEGTEFLPQRIRGLAFKIPAKENETARTVKGNILQRPRLRAAGQNHLSHLFFRAHGCQQLQNGIPGQLRLCELLLGGLRCLHRLRQSRGKHRLRFRPAAGKQQRQGQYIDYLHLPFPPIRLFSQFIRRYTTVNTAAANAQVRG